MKSRIQKWWQKKEKKIENNTADKWKQPSKSNKC